MNLVVQEATDRKVITFTTDHTIIQKHRHRSIHVTNIRHESATIWLYNDKGLQTRLRDSKMPHCQRRLYEEELLDPTLSEHSQIKIKSEIFGTSTCVHAMSIIYRGTDIQHVVDTRRYTLHVLVA